MPVRTAGSASSSMTAATPPIKSAMGFLKMRHDSESDGSRALSPRGRVKSIEGPFFGFKSARVPTSSLLWMFRGNRMIDLLGGTAREPSGRNDRNS
jgi:hypothetical protein